MTAIVRRLAAGYEAAAPDEQENNWTAYANARGHWLASNAGTVVHTLAPINYRTDHPRSCNTPALLLMFAAPTEAPVSPDREVVEHSWSNYNLSRGFKSRHPGGVNLLFADGSVHFVSEEIDHWTFQFLGCRFEGVHIEDIP